MSNLPGYVLIVVILVIAWILSLRRRTLRPKDLLCQIDTSQRDALEEYMGDSEANAKADRDFMRAMQGRRGLKKLSHNSRVLIGIARYFMDQGCPCARAEYYSIYRKAIVFHVYLLLTPIDPILSRVSGETSFYIVRAAVSMYCKIYTQVRTLCENNEPNLIADMGAWL